MPHLESAVITVVRELILDGFRHHPSSSSVPPELLTTAISCSIYGSTQEWVKTPNRGSSEEMVDIIVKLVSPTLALSHADNS